MNTDKVEIKSPIQEREAIIMVDPSYFTPSYDHHLCQSLSQLGCKVTLVIRETRQNEPQYQCDYEVKHSFYLFTEKILQMPFPQGISKIIKILKGIEHFFCWIWLLGFVLRRRPQCVHFQWLPLPLIDICFLYLLRPFTRIVFTVHDTTPFLNAPTSKVQIFGWYSLPSKVDHLIVHTQKSAKVLKERGVAESKISVIPHGVVQFDSASSKLAQRSSATHLQSSIQTELERQASTLSYGDISQSSLVSKTIVSKIILLFGVLKPYKGADVLLKAFAMLDPLERQEWRVQITGKPGMDPEPLKELARHLKIENQVDWDLRFVPEEEINTIAENAEIFAFPYRDIDASGVLMSFLGYGKAIVASRLGVFAELILNNDSGLLVEPENEIDLAKALKILMEDSQLRLRLGQGARLKAQSVMPWAETAKLTMQIYCEKHGE